MGSDQDMTAPQGSAPQGASPERTIMHRKVQAGRAEHQSRAMSLAKALRLTLAKVADEMFDMSMAVIGVRSETCPGEGLVEHLADPGLLMLLDGPSRARAAAFIDPSLVGALIQQQTMGKVLSLSDGPERPMTPTDAAISAPFLDTLLSRTTPVPDDPQEQHLIAGYTFGAWVEDVRVLGMALDAPEYELIHLSIDISGGVRQGRILLCMPKGQGARVEATGRNENADLSQSLQPPVVALSDTVMNLPANLRISLAHIRMTLRCLGELEVGSIVELETSALDKVVIEALTGRPVGRGALGQLDGKRAVQVQSTRRVALPLRRRESDREELNLPDISKPVERRIEPEERADITPLPNIPVHSVPDLADLPDLPDMSDLPDLPDMSDLPELNVG